MKLLKILSLVSLVTALSSGQSIPGIKAKTLDDSEILLPRPGGQQFLIFIVGFSRKSGDLCAVWSKKISAEYRSDARISYFSLPVLEGAPSLVRPLIIHGIRKGLPAQERSHFVPIYSNESDWKKLVNYSTPDDAYLIVAAPDGHVLWQAHGPYSDATFAELKKYVSTLLEKSSTPSATN